MNIKAIFTSVPGAGAEDAGNEHDWRKALDADLDSYWPICQVAVHQFARQPAGKDRYKITAASSTRDRFRHSSGYAADCSSKTGLDGMICALGGEWEN